MSRLLHAAARGARIEIRVFNEYSWRNAYNLDLNKGSAASDWVYRIHPDDEHLQYGPISTALREMALTGEYEDGTIPYFSFEIEREGKYWESTADQRRVFCLILAEALADEGM